MKNKAKLVQAAISGILSVGALATVQIATAADANPNGECWGVNTCKGKTDCHTPLNQCAGMNACKGKGWKTMKKVECESKVLEEAKKTGLYFKKAKT